MLPVAGLKMLTSDAQAAFKADQEYVDEHFDEWMEAYRDHWVLVKDGELLLVTRSEQDVAKAIEQYGQMAIVSLMRPRGFRHVTTEPSG